MYISCHANLSCRRHRKCLFIMSCMMMIFLLLNVCLLCVVRAWNYGAMGAVMGHELSHAFDDQGSQYDKHGNLNNWWSSKSQKGFSTLKQCFIDQYSGYTLHGHNVSAVILYRSVNVTWITSPQCCMSTFGMNMDCAMGLR